MLFVRLLSSHNYDRRTVQCQSEQERETCIVSAVFPKGFHNVSSDSIPHRFLGWNDISLVYSRVYMCVLEIKRVFFYHPVDGIGKKEWAPRFQPCGI